MSSLTFLERSALEKLLGMSGGYVLDFSNRTFQEFIAECTGRDIFHELYDNGSGSKANRLRAFWKIEPDDLVGKLLTELLQYARHGIQTGTDGDLIERCERIAARLSGGDPMSTTRPMLFLSYARPDLAPAVAVVDLLKKAGLRTWFDEKDLKGGQDWEFVIRQRISEAAIVLVCLSVNSVDRKGFFHKEMRLAVSEAMKLPKGRVYVMPVRLTECEIPDDLAQWHAIDLFTSGASHSLLESIGMAIGCGCRATREAHESFADAIRRFNAGSTDL